MNTQKNINATPYNYITISIISIFIFDIISSLLAYSVSFDVGFFFSIMLMATLLGVLSLLIVFAFIRLRHREIKPAICIGASALICLFLTLNPHLAVYQTEMAKFLINGRPYLREAEINHSAIKVYHWHEAGGLSEPTFIDLVFDPNSKREWAREANNLDMTTSKEVPSYLLNRRCNHRMDGLFDHFYVVVTTCQASALSEQ